VGQPSEAKGSSRSFFTPSSLVGWPAAFALVVAIALFAGCRRKSQPKPPAQAGGIACPSADELAKLVAEPGRIARTDCTVYSPGFFWLAVALTTAEKPPLAPRLLLLSGGGALSPIAFDVEPIPAAALERFLGNGGETAVKIRKTRSSQHLVRLGVVSRRPPKGVEWDEIGILLQLAAHAPPQLLWTGPGDASSLGPDGCVTERQVEFEMPFRNDLQMFTTSRSSPGKPGIAAQDCVSGGPGTQEGLAYRPLSLKAGRKLR
jgi:hypothetical protein